MFRKVLVVYVAACATLIAVSLATGYRATRIAGTPHYLLTRTHVQVRRAVPPQNPTDAAFDALFEEAGEPVEMMVERPAFVLGLLDATGPLTAAGGLALLIAWARRRRRRS